MKNILVSFGWGAAPDMGGVKSTSSYIPKVFAYDGVICYCSMHRRFEILN